MKIWNQNLSIQDIDPDTETPENEEDEKECSQLRLDFID